MRIRTAFAAFALAAGALVTAAGSASADGRDINVNVNNGVITNIICNAEAGAAFVPMNLGNQTAIACTDASTEA